MKAHSKKYLEEVLSRHVDRIDRRIHSLEYWSSRFSNARLVYFVLSVVLIFSIGNIISDALLWSLVALLAVPFIWMGMRHATITRTIQAFSHLKAIKNEHIARMKLRWDGIPAPAPIDIDKHHPFADDLNIAGNRSVHQLIDTSIFEGSSELLASWLLTERPNHSEIELRQNLVQELTTLSIFRDRLRVQAQVTKQHASEKDWTMGQMLEWLGIERNINFNTPLFILSVGAITNVILGTLAILGIIKPFVIVSFVLYLSYYFLQAEKVKGLFDAAFQLDKLLTRFGNILLYVEDFSFGNKPNLKKHCSVFHNKNDRPSTYLKKITRLSAAASVQKNQFLWPVINSILPWDMYYAKKMELLKPELKVRLEEWLSIFHELEALSSIANYAYLNPEYTFAEPIQESTQTVFKATDMGHPLIPDHQKVTNNFEVTDKGQLFLITGSNMAGKSTFLRTLGLNLCLYFAGAPVNASIFETQLVRIFTSINVKDSLGDGLSHFYAEVRRLKRLLDELNKDDSMPLFFFVDEIFKGTNNKERFLGSTAFLKEVASKKGIGLVSTHDLELAHLDKELPQLSNWHFEETVKDDKMYFEYKLKPGPCPTTNALRIMEIEGLPVE